MAGGIQIFEEILLTLGNDRIFCTNWDEARARCHGMTEDKSHQNKIADENKNGANVNGVSVA